MFSRCIPIVMPSTNKQKDVKGTGLSATAAKAAERNIMCGIIGYSGIENSVPKLIEGLKALE